jgi:hypothetical protein
VSIRFGTFVDFRALNKNRSGTVFDPDTPTYT